MNVISKLKIRFRSLWSRPVVKGEIDEELQFHIQERTRENRTAGMAPEEAAREARKRFGNIQSIREECRERRGAVFGESLLKDIQLSLRMLKKNLSFAVITAATLALGVAGNIVIFTVYNAFYLRPFPFVDQQQLVDLDETAPRWNLEYTGLAYPDLCGWKEYNHTFESMGAWTYTTRNLSFEGSLDRVHGARVTQDLPVVFGTKPVLGRLFALDEDRPGGANVVLLGNGFWKSRFGGSKEVLGKTLKLDHESFTIIGVLPPDKDVMVEAEFWIPLAMDPNNLKQGWFLRGAGRLKKGVSLDKAQEDLRRVHAGLVEKHRAEASTFPRLTTLNDRFFGNFRLLIQVMLGAVGVVLVIASGNASALMLARGLARAREFAIRQSLGSSQRRLAQLIGVESLILALLGGLAGVLLGGWGIQLLLSSLTEKPPRWVRFDMDWRVWGFAGFMILLAALLGALPVICSTFKTGLQGALQSSTQQSTRASGGRRGLHFLVVTELALTLILMVQAGLLVQTFHSVQRVDPGFRSDHVLLYEIALPHAKYGLKEAQTAFFQEHLERVRGLPGVELASAASFPPLSGHFGTFYTIENAPPKRTDEPSPAILQRTIFPGYFEAMGISILAGRSLTEQDGQNQGSQVVIVDESFAKRSWPGNDPIGKRISNNGGVQWLTVVGVARDVRHYGLDQPVRPGVYLPFAQNIQDHLTLIVRCSVAPASLVPSIRALVNERDSDLPVFGVATMEERLAQSMWARRLTASLFGTFAAVALLMAVGGIYGVFSYVVSRRTQEIGVRLALGAQHRDVLWLVVRQGLALAFTGIGIGLVGALLIAPLMSRLLLGVSPFDPLTFAGIAVLLTAASVLACFLPARRAARVDPMVALRCE